MAGKKSQKQADESRVGETHVAIIMDGNGRWAKRRLLPRHAGHRAGVRAARRAVEASVELGVRTLTLFAFSSENWNRPEAEVRKLMALFVESLNKQVPELHEQGVRLRIIGDRSSLSPELKEQISASESMTAKNQRLDLVVAVSYGGRWDIVEAAKRIAADVASGQIETDQIDESLLGATLQTAAIPDPDLFIRTGGERRISNFLIWDLAYTELYFTDLLWPDFGPKEFETALASFTGRERRFGLTTEQLKAGHA